MARSLTIALAGRRSIRWRSRLRRSLAQALTTIRAALPIGSAAYAAYYADPLRFFGTLAPALSNVHSPRFYSEDVSLLKKTRITETVTFELGAEAFNLFNRTYYFFPTTDLRDAGNFGFQSVGANNPRRVQLRVRLTF